MPRAGPPRRGSSAGIAVGGELGRVEPEPVIWATSSLVLTCCSVPRRVRRPARPARRGRSRWRRPARPGRLRRVADRERRADQHVHPRPEPPASAGPRRVPRHRDRQHHAPVVRASQAAPCVRGRDVAGAARALGEHADQRRRPAAPRPRRAAAPGPARRGGPASWPIRTSSHGRAGPRNISCLTRNTARRAEQSEQQRAVDERAVVGDQHDRPAGRDPLGPVHVHPQHGPHARAGTAPVCRPSGAGGPVPAAATRRAGRSGARAVSRLGAERGQRRSCQQPALLGQRQQAWRARRPR